MSKKALTKSNKDIIIKLSIKRGGKRWVQKTKKMINS